MAASMIRNLLYDTLRLPQEQIDQMIDIAPTTYRKYHIAKKSNPQSSRTIYHPSKPTKAMQYVLMKYFQKNTTISVCAYGYVRGLHSPLRSCVEVHSHSRHIIRLDIADFFPSIIPEDLFQSINESDLSNDDEGVIRNTCFVRGHGSKEFRLAVGSPASPLISNIVMAPLDAKLAALAVSFGDGCHYTRYSDDLLFSTRSNSDLATLSESIINVIHESKSPRLRINATKNRAYRPGCSKRLLGLVLSDNGNIGVGRDRKKRIRSMIHSYINSDELRRSELHDEVQGTLAWLRDVEPSYFNGLVVKYGGGLFP